MEDFWKKAETCLNLKIKQIKPLSGGDISAVFKIETTTDSYVLKLNELKKSEIFDAEAFGLRLLTKAGIFRVPKVVQNGNIEQKAFLLIEFISEGNANEFTQQNFGEKLAEQHQISQKSFGLEFNNFIGSLPQSNLGHCLWERFFWHERIKPQLEMAIEKGFMNIKILEQENKFLQLFKNVFNPHPPALLHGDLWSGNYLIDESGNAVLIDPAVYYGHPMMDIGMTKLFGGFGKDFYDAYFQNSSISGDVKTQIELAQLYYLLVHLNLFGKSYLKSVNQILRLYLGGI